jgi:transcriptional regulator of acetoin/glycerol metabolism
MNLLKNKEIAGLSPAVLEAFLHHDWPGNIRELENVIERAFILCPGGMIQCRHLPDTFACGDEGPDILHDGDTLADMEIKTIREALVRNNWNRSATARELGVDRGTIWRKCKQFKIEPPASRKIGV